LITIYRWIAVFLVFVSASLSAQSFLDLTQDDEGFLPHEQAFQFDYSQNNDKLTLRWVIAPEYYLYRDKVVINDNAGAITEQLDAESHTDEYFGNTWIYRQYAEVTVQLNNVAAEAGKVSIGYQGCAEAGLCYPPMTQTIHLDAFTPAPAANGEAETADLTLWSILIFIAVGAGLALTPCVLPMYPIISGVVLGGDVKQTLSRSLVLAFSYTQGMALTYTGMGILVALLGAQFQAYLQHPAVIVFIAILFVALALAMFGVFNLQAPQGLMNRLHSVQIKGGKVVNTFLIGALSGLIASPCTTAPLSGVLLYIAQSGDVLQGAVSLYALAIGMGVPLILFVLGGHKLIPKAGAWMNSVKIIFGIALLGVALMFIERLVSVSIANYLWIGFAAVSTVVIASEFRRHLKGIIKHVVTILTYFVGIVVVASFMSANKEGLAFSEIKTPAELAQVLESHPDKLVIFDLYADWCVACKEFERYTFTDDAVKAFVSKHDIQTVKIDMTTMDAEKEQLMKTHRVLGLPTILLFKNNEVVGRITGYEGPDDFIQSLEAHLDQ
jgi:thiol:disulfide interchange protein DsbD